MVKKKKERKGEDPSSTTEWELESLTSQSTGTETDTSAAGNHTSDTEDDDQLPQKDSLEQLDERTDIEKKLFDLVGDGDHDAVKEFIVLHRPRLDVTHRDIDGDDILAYAVDLGDRKMVRIILDIDPAAVDTSSGLISAIKENRMGIVLDLLQFEDSRNKGAAHSMSTLREEKYQGKKKKGSKKKKKKPRGIWGDQKKYGKHLTPLMAAAINGHYEIMQVLYDRKERLPELHVPSCKCSECKKNTRDVQNSLKRVELLKAMANPIYMIFMGSQDPAFDPILESFLLCETLEQCAEEEPEFKGKYEEILKQAEAFPAQLLDLCRSAEELKTVLSQREGYTGPQDHPFPRLGLAIDMAQKKFVTHNSIESLIHAIWIGHSWSTNSTQEKMMKYLFIAVMVVLFPFVQVLIWLGLFCCSSLPLMRFLCSPVNRSWGKAASHLYLMAMLLGMNNSERPGADIEPPTIYLRWMVVAFVISNFVCLFRRFLIHPRGFWKKGWNRWEAGCQCLFWGAFAIWIHLFIRKSELAFEDFVPRKLMDRSDLVLIGDILFALASTFYSLKILRWYVLSSLTGQVQSAMAKVWKALLLSVILLAVISLSFVVGTDIILRNFHNITELNDDGKPVDQKMTMTDWEHMFLTFIGLGGGIAPEDAKIHSPSDNFINRDTGREDTAVNHPYTSRVFLYSICVVFSVIVMKYLQPALIGVYTSEQEKLLKCRMSWKYMRIQEWLYHINDTYLAPPFNFLPTFSCCGDTFSTLKFYGSRGRSGRRRSLDGDVESLEDLDPEEAYERRKYPFVLRKLFFRYFQTADREKGEKEPPKVNDVMDVQQLVKEVKELASELVGIQRKDSVTRRGSRTQAEPGPRIVLATPKRKLS